LHRVLAPRCSTPQHADEELLAVFDIRNILWSYQLLAVLRPDRLLEVLTDDACQNPVVMRPGRFVLGVSTDAPSAPSADTESPATPAVAAAAPSAPASASASLFFFFSFFGGAPP